MSTTGDYVGRFAPSPTGPLHFGSLLAAVASYAQAKSHGGRWLLRIEDIDPPREIAGADRWIIDALETHGFQWDGDVVYQSAATERHLQLIDELIRSGAAYPCTCSRRDLAEVESGPLGQIYPGTCRQGCGSGNDAIRLLTGPQEIRFSDALQGEFRQNLEESSGDFVIRRKDGLVAYNFAVVVDDADQGITEVVRGVDLLDSTPRHIFLQQVLNFPTPDYLHIPVVLNEEGQKLSKLTGATGLDLAQPGRGLVAAASALGQSPPQELADAAVTEIWPWIIENWDLSPLSGVREIPPQPGPYAPA